MIILEILQQISSTILYVAIAYAIYKVVKYFTSEDSESNAFDGEKVKTWNEGKNILIGHQTRSQSVLKQMVDDKESSINETTFVKVSARFKTIQKDFGNDCHVHLHIRSPGGSMFYAMLIAYQVFLWKGRVTAHIHQMACSGGTLIALSCNEIVMENDSVLGPIDPQVNKTMPSYSATQILKIININPLEIKEDSEYKQAVIPNKANAKESELMPFLEANLILSQAFDLIKVYKEFLHKILAKNYEEESLREKIISFFWLSRPHSMPIFRDECKKIGLNIAQ